MAYIQRWQPDFRSFADPFNNIFEREVEKKKKYLKKFLKGFLGKVGILGNFKPDGPIMLIQQGFTELQILGKLY